MRLRRTGVLDARRLLPVAVGGPKSCSTSTANLLPSSPTTSCSRSKRSSDFSGSMQARTPMIRKEPIWLAAKRSSTEQKPDHRRCARSAVGRVSSTPLPASGLEPDAPPTTRKAHLRRRAGGQTVWGRLRRGSSERRSADLIGVSSGLIADVGRDLTGLGDFDDLDFADGDLEGGGCVSGCSRSEVHLSTVARACDADVT